jgi:hypothetical protein
MAETFLPLDPAPDERVVRADDAARPRSSVARRAGSRAMRASRSFIPPGAIVV